MISEVFLYVFWVLTLLLALCFAVTKNESQWSATGAYTEGDTGCASTRK